MPKAKTRVLIVDDAERVRKAIGWILEKHGSYEVAGYAANGLECLELLKYLHPDLIALDINMPEMEGIETLKRIRERSTVPVVIISALPVDDKSMREYLYEIGANACIPKVFGDDAIGVSAFEGDLLSTLDKVLNNHCVTSE
jgi:chemotaxis response regulator CheB